MIVVIRIFNCYLQSMSFLPLVADLFVKKKSPVQIEDSWCRLHYRTTVLILFLFAGLTCLTDYFGAPIKCTQLQEDTNNEPVIPSQVLNNYCFISTTFTVS